MATTTVVEPHFKLSLPGEWRHTPTKDQTLWQYVCETGTEQLSISIHVSRTPIGDAERPVLVKQLQTIRLKAENGQITEPTQQPVRDICIGLYSGYDADSQRRFSNLTLVNAQVIGNFYYEALDMPQSDFVERSASVLGGIGLSAPQR
jgi:hypothetical protein